MNGRWKRKKDKEDGKGRRKRKEENGERKRKEERHRQQLLDLEEAMRSTWEAKSKVRYNKSHSFLIL